MNWTKMILALCATGATIAYWVTCRQDGTALTGLLAFLGGLAIGSIPSANADEVSNQL
jgi:hypothetical protein